MTQIGKIIGGYKIRREVGKGGMGVVFRAEHPVLGDRPPVAIKMLNPHLVQEADIKKRFRREAQVQEKLKHECIVELKEYLEEGNDCYIIMEFFKGKPLSDIIGKETGPMKHDRSIPIMKQILKGIGYAHDNNIIHRDIKPSNILVGRGDKVKITDFGIAKIVDDTTFTMPGTKIGTMHYMSPEQVKGKEAGKPSDIYSLGATLYEMVSAHVPFDYDSDYKIEHAHVNETPKSPKTHYPHIPDHVEGAIMKALSKNPNDRFRSCESFIDALDKEKIDIPPPKPKPPKKEKKKKKGQKEKAPVGFMKKRGFGFMLSLFVVALIVILISLPNSDSNVIDVDQLFEQGQKAFHNEQYYIAISKLREVVKIKPDHYKARLYFGWSYYYTESYGPAKFQASEVIENSPSNNDDAEGYFLRSFCNYSLNILNKALDDINLSINLEPDDPEPYLFRGKILFDLKDYNGSYSSARNALRRNPDFGPAYGLLGEISYKRGDLAQACENWVKAVDLGNNYYQEMINDQNCR